ncbi:alcohol dehydrogenase [Alphaproteobacteria bacterium]|nr:alcohol dehydrogenase [Alphaproteobacteria bacterium]
MTEAATIVLPRIMKIGGGASLELGGLLKSLGLKNPLIVTDPFMAEKGPLPPIKDALKSAGLSFRVFPGVVPDPTVASVKAGLAFLKEDSHDCVVGFGGGSSIDTAKMIAVLSVHGGEISNYKAPHLQNEPGLPIFAIPTTAGSGSEATRVSIITNEATDEKMMCPGPGFQPTAALIDYELSLTAPRRLTADTGLDALTHAIEAYVSKRANPFADGLALAAMKAIWSNLPIVCAEPGNRPAREAVMLGATQAGMAFSNSSVALVHGMSRPIGAFFHVPHGLSNAMLLPVVTAFSVGSATGRYATCARTIGLCDDKTSDEAAVDVLVKALTKVAIDLDVPTPKAYGIDEKKWFGVMETMAEQALASGSPGNNPRVPTAGEICQLYKDVWNA